MGIDWIAICVGSFFKFFYSSCGESTLCEHWVHDWALATCDFAENFLCKFQNEPQSAHWAYRQVTVFPVAVFFRRPGKECHDLKRESLVFLSDDLRHDAHATQAFVQRTLDHLRKVKSFTKVVFLSRRSWTVYFQAVYV